MKIGATSLGWHGAPLPNALEQLHEFGGECVELTSKVDGHAGFVLEPATIPLVRELTRNYGLTITSIGGYNDFAQVSAHALASEIVKLVRVCEVASELKALIVRAFVADRKSDLGSDLYPRILDGFRRAAERAATLGIVLAIENHGRWWNDAPALAQLIQEINAPNVGLTLDTGNFCWAGHSRAQFERDWQNVLPYVRSVHIKDGAWQANGEFEFVPAGDGELNVAAILAALAARGYAGAVCSEYEGSGDFVRGTRTSITYLRGVRDGLVQGKSQ